MYFLYVDESGDPGPIIPGHPNPPSPHYILSGVALPAREWRNQLTPMVDIRRILRDTYGLPVRAEMHGAEFFRPQSAPYKGWATKKIRLQCYRDFLSMASTRLTNAKLFNVHIDKRNPKSAATVTSPQAIKEAAWLRLLQRFNTYLQRSCGNSLGMVFSDQGDEFGMRRFLRARRLHNLAPTLGGDLYNVPLSNIVEDPIMRDSKFSYFVQMADMTSHALYRKLYSKPSLKKMNADRLFDLLKPLCLIEASRHDPHGMGIVHG